MALDSKKDIFRKVQTKNKQLKKLLKTTLNFVQRAESTNLAEAAMELGARIEKELKEN